MKKLLPIFVAVLVCFGFQAHAQTSIGFVDVEKVLSEAESAEALNKKRLAARDKFVEAVSGMEKELREEGQAIAASGDSLTEEEFIEKKKSYESKLLELRGATEKKKRAFDKASDEALSKLQDHLSDSVKAVAKEKGYDIVLSIRNVVAGDKQLDITDDVIKVMNDKKIKIPFEVKE